MGLEDTVYKQGTVTSRKDLDEITLSHRAMATLIEQQVYEGYNPDWLFSNCTDEEIKAVVEYLDDELEKDNPFDDASEGLDEQLQRYRSELIDLLI